MEHTLAEMGPVKQKHAKGRRNQTRSKISSGMQKLEQTHGLCADGSSAGNDALASSGSCVARRRPASPGLQSEGTRSREPAPAKKKVSAATEENLSPQSSFQQSFALFRLFSSGIPELAFSDPAWDNSWRCLALRTGSVLFHSVPQKLSKLTQTGYFSFHSPGRQVCVQPESTQQVFTHILVREMLETWLTLIFKLWFTTSCHWDQTSFGG